MNIVRKHKGLFFYIATYLLTGILFFVPVLMFSSLSFPLYLMSPAIISFVMITVLDKLDGIRRFIKELFPAGFRLKWLIICTTLLPVTIVLAANIADSIIQGQSFNYHNSAISITPGFILMIGIGCIGEEIGWRGYLLPLLLKRHSNLVSSILLGIFWGLWHAGDYGEGLGFLLFVLSTIAISIIMTWLYHKNSGNILAAILFHFFYNLTGSYVAFIPENGTPSITSRVIMAIACMIPAIILIVLSPVFRGKQLK
ncbi:MAG: type II CAAX endopeptidase family protein [Lacrimispora sp.]